MGELSSVFAAAVTVLLVTSFVKIFTALNIMRYGMGLSGAGFGVVLAGVALALSLVVMDGPLGPKGGLLPVLRGEKQISEAELEGTLTPFLEKHTDPAMLASLTPKSAAGEGAQSAPPKRSFGATVAGFVLSEVREAFQLGLLFLVPFIVIDLLVANVLLALGSTQLPALVVSLPLKLLLFVSIDGWRLVTERLLGGYLG